MNNSPTTKSTKTKKISLLKQIVLLSVCLVALPLLILGYESILQMNKTFRNDLVTATTADVEKISTQVNNIFLPMKQIAKSAEVFVQTAHNTTELDENFKRLFDSSENFFDIYYCTEIHRDLPKGFFISADGWDPDADWDPTTRDWYKAAKANPDEFIFTDPYIDAQTGDLCVTLSKAVEVNGSFNGVLAIDSFVNGLHEKLQESRLTENSVVYMVDSKGTYITNGDESKVMEANYLEESNLCSIFNKTEEEVFDGELHVYVSKKRFYGINSIPGTPWFIVTEGNLAELSSVLLKIVRIVIWNLVILIVLSVLVAFLVSRDISKSFTLLSKGCQDFSKGDFTERFNSFNSKEANELSDGFNELASNMTNLVTNIKTAASDIKEVSDGVWNTTTEIKNSIEEVDGSVSSINKMVDEENAAIKDVNNLVSAIVSETNSLNKSVVKQGQILSESGLAIQEMAQNVISTGENTNTIADSMRKLVSDSQSNKNQLADSTNEIKAVKDASKQLLEINDVISAVAAQTNLLAMNAAIEAAHAGEAGKGFAVVADEIRKLAETTSQQANSSKDSIDSIAAKIDEITLSSENISTSFGQTIGQILEVSTVIEKLKNTVEEQTSQAGQIINSLKDIDEISKNVIANTKTITTSTEKAENLCGKISSLSSQVTNCLKTCNTDVEALGKNSQELTKISEIAKNNSQKLQDSVSVFKVL